jgi:hypothetical protein
LQMLLTKVTEQVIMIGELLGLNTMWKISVMCLRVADNIPNTRNTHASIHRPKYPTLTRIMAYNVWLIKQYMND